MRGPFPPFSEQSAPNAAAVLFFEGPHTNAADRLAHPGRLKLDAALFNDGAGNFTPGTAQPVAGSVVRSAVPIWI
jgi:hypothetical protein